MHSNKYTLGFMTIVAVILGSFLSVAAGSLKEIQELNVENDSKKNILSCLGFKEDPKNPWGPNEIQNMFNKNITAIVLDINGKRTNLDPKTMKIIFLSTLVKLMRKSKVMRYPFQERVCGLLFMDFLP